MISRTFIAAVSCMVLSVGLSGCAYIMDESNQSLTIETPGADYAHCDVYIDKLRYNFYPPETQTVIKSPNEMKVKCRAAGNRDKTIYVKALIEDSTFYSTVNGVLPGAAWDYASNAMFKYPETVYVDFTDIPVSDMDMPQHDHPDVRGIDDYQMEEFVPSAPAMNKDTYRPPGAELRRRDEYNDYDSPGDEFNDAPMGNVSGESQTAAPALGKGDLMAIEKSLPPSYDAQPPVMYDEPSADSTPAPLVTPNEE